MTRTTLFLEASKELAATDGDVEEWSHSLNALIGFPPDRKLNLTVPEPISEKLRDLTRVWRSVMKKLVGKLVCSRGRRGRNVSGRNRLP
jgi:hypothetical protein